MKIKALQRCKAFFIPARILEAANIQCFIDATRPRENAIVALRKTAWSREPKSWASDG